MIQKEESKEETQYEKHNLINGKKQIKTSSLEQSTADTSPNDQELPNKILATDNLVIDQLEEVKHS